MQVRWCVAAGPSWRVHPRPHWDHNLYISFESDVVIRGKMEKVPKSKKVQADEIFTIFGLSAILRSRPADSLRWNRHSKEPEKVDSALAPKAPVKTDPHLPRPWGIFCFIASHLSALEFHGNCTDARKSSKWTPSASNLRPIAQMSCALTVNIPLLPCFFS